MRTLIFFELPDVAQSNRDHLPPLNRPPAFYFRSQIFSTASSSFFFMKISINSRIIELNSSLAERRLGTDISNNVESFTNAAPQDCTNCRDIRPWSWIGRINGCHCHHWTRFKTAESPTHISPLLKKNGSRLSWLKRSRTANARGSSMVERFLIKMSTSIRVSFFSYLLLVTDRAIGHPPTYPHPTYPPNSLF